MIRGDLRLKAPLYVVVLKVYFVLAVGYRFGLSQLRSRVETLDRLHTIKTGGLRGGVIYYDGQFDDSRLLINLVQTAAEQGATLLNYAPVIALDKDSDGFVNGVAARDLETGHHLNVQARVVVNATGPFCDNVRRLADPQIRSMIAPSQGIHLVFDRSFLPVDSAIMVPHTSDQRVMFAIPWHEHTLVGTTDTPILEPSLEPLPLGEEIEFILSTAGQYLSKAPTRKDILSAFVGIRPLVRAGGASSTAALSRDHTIHIDSSGLLTVAGGKWTTYRNIAEYCVNQAATLARLAERPCITRNLNIHGFHQHAEKFGALAIYGSDASGIQDLIQSNPGLGETLHPALPYCGAEVVWSTRFEMARTVEDVLARRTRALFLNARAAIEIAPLAARLMSKELNYDRAWESEQIKAFELLARRYLVEDLI